MRSMNVLVFVLIALTEASKYPNTKERIPRISQPSSSSFLNCSNAAYRGYCDSGWAYFKETEACYKNFYSATFHEAENICKDFGGHLTSIHSYTENSFVAELAQMGIQRSADAQGTWIGLVRSDYLKSNGKDYWMWTDGTAMDFVAWGPNEPNNYGGIQRCVLLLPDPYVGNYYDFYQKWSDHSCAIRARSFVCKRMAIY